MLLYLDQLHSSTNAFPCQCQCLSAWHFLIGSTNTSLCNSSDPKVPSPSGEFKCLHYITGIILWLLSLWNVVSLFPHHSEERVCPRETLLLVWFGKCSFPWHTADTGLLAAGLKKLTQKYNKSIGDDNSSHPPTENHKCKKRKKWKVQVLLLDYSLKCLQIWPLLSKSLIRLETHKKIQKGLKATERDAFVGHN